MRLYNLLKTQVELVKVTTPEESRNEHETLTQQAEAILKVSSWFCAFSPRVPAQNVKVLPGPGACRSQGLVLFTFTENTACTYPLIFAPGPEATFSKSIVVQRGHRIRGSVVLRLGGVDAGAKCLQGNFVLQQLPRFPGAPHGLALP